MKEKIINKKEEFVIVPVSWFEELLQVAEKAEKDSGLGKQFLVGYLSSAKTILRYSKRVDNY